ncbi:MAG: WGR domain-containing protein [Phormidesmis sp.]
MEYQLEKWKRQDWRKNTRHYSCEVRQNQFGQWVVLRQWGRVSALKGQSLENPCGSYEQSLEVFEAVEKRRAKRGYRTW